MVSSVNASNLWEEDVKPETQTRSCCNCIFFLLVLWIWIALVAGLALDELASRKMKDVTQEINQIKCGWQTRSFLPVSTQPLTQNYKEHSHLRASHEKGRAYFALVICVAPFAAALIASVCMKNGDEEIEGGGVKPGDVEAAETFARSIARQKRAKVSVKVIGFVGTFVFEVAAYMVFSTAFENCSGEPFPTTSLKTDGAPRIGRTMLLLLSAVVATGILVVIMVALIVILTSENANELGFVKGIAAGMATCGCDGGCPECDAIDCDDCGGGDSGGGSGGGNDTNSTCSEICCCC